MKWVHSTSDLFPSITTELNPSASFLEAIEVFVREHVEVVIHSGDILDEPRPYGDAMRVLLEGARG